MLDDLLDMLVAAGLVQPGEEFPARRPPKPLRCVTARETGAEPPETTLSGTVTEKARVQLEFRDARYDLARAWAQAVWVYFNQQEHAQNVGWNGVEYRLIDPYGSVIDLGDDEGKRPLVGFNLRVERVSIEDGVAM